jgi:hypothetical protein
VYVNALPESADDTAGGVDDAALASSADGDRNVAYATTAPTATITPKNTTSKAHIAHGHDLAVRGVNATRCADGNGAAATSATVSISAQLRLTTNTRTERSTRGASSATSSTIAPSRGSTGPA